MPKTDNFGDVFPPRNLGAATPWGRHVEIRIDGLERASEGVAQRVQNENRTLTAKAELQAEQMGKLASQQEILESQQLALRDSQGKLEAQQGQLERQQGELQNLVESLPITSTHSGKSEGFTIPSGTKSQITVTVPVPEGKSRASVFVFGQSLFFSHNVSSAGVAGWRAIISGNSGEVGPTVPLNMDGKSVSFSHSRNFTVTPGGSFNVIAQTTAGESHGSGSANTANMHITVTFS